MPQEPQYELRDPSDGSLIGTIYANSNNEIVIHHGNSGNEATLTGSGINVDGDVSASGGVSASGNVTADGSMSTGGNPVMHTGGWDEISIGSITTNDGTFTTGFEPRYIEFYGARHPAGFNSTYDSGDNNGENNALSTCRGFATAATAGEQMVVNQADGSDSVNGHLSYAGDGEVIHLITTDGRNSVVNGRTRAEVSSFNSDGFDLNWTATYDSIVAIYRAYR